jgi:hypothetical protein
MTPLAHARHAGSAFGGAVITRELALALVTLAQTNAHSHPAPSFDGRILRTHKAGLDRAEFDLDDDGLGRLWHKLSGSYFVIHRDLTWRHLEHYAVSDGSERLFDLSWPTVIPQWEYGLPN